MQLKLIHHTWEILQQLPSSRSTGYQSAAACQQNVSLVCMHFCSFLHIIGAQYSVSTQLVLDFEFLNTIKYAFFFCQIRGS